MKMFPIVKKPHILKYRQTIASSEEPDNLNKDWSFNPLDGFKINIVDSWEIMGQYQCEATWFNSSKKSVSTKFKIEIHGIC